MLENWVDKNERGGARQGISVISLRYVDKLLAPPRVVDESTLAGGVS